MTAGDRSDLLFLYVAGALQDAERDEVEEWIASGAPEAADFLVRAEHEVALLAASQRRPDPSPDVRERLLARADTASDRSRTAAERRAPRARRTPWFVRPALAAGLAGLVAAGVAGYAAHRIATDAGSERQAALQRDLDLARGELESLAGDREDLDSELADAEAKQRALESDLVLAQKTIDVLQAEHAESLALAGTSSAPTASGRVFWDWDAWYCYARVAGLPKDPARIYAMWLFTEDGAIGVGTFRADAEGNAIFLSPVPRDIGHVLRAGVSIEPDEDLASKPRGEVVMVGEVGKAKADG